MIELATNSFFNRYNSKSSPVKGNLANVYAKHSALCPDDEISIPILAEDSERSKKIFEFKKYLVWNIRESITRLDGEVIQMILKAYSFVSNPPANNTSAIMLAQNPGGFARKGLDSKSSEVLRILYSKISYSKEDTVIFDVGKRYTRYAEQLAMDYYLEGITDVYVKAHPRFTISTEEAKHYYGSNAETLGVLPFDFFQYFLI